MKNPQEFIIMLSLSEEENDLLLLLAQKINPQYSNWYTDCGINNNELFQCFLCDEVFSLGDKMVKHGKMHINNSNLMAFI